MNYFSIISARDLCRAHVLVACSQATIPANIKLIKLDLIYSIGVD